MFAGHLGTGLMLKRADRSVGLGTLFFAAMLLDFVLWTLVLAGVESVRVPFTYRRTVDFEFDFPYSHSLAAAVVWSGAGFAGVWLTRRSGSNRWKAASVVGAAVFSHFILDWAVHSAELPLVGRDSTMLGLGLWRHLPLAWCVEGAIAVAGLSLYLVTVKLSERRRAALIWVMVLVLLMTFKGQASTGTPPKPVSMAVSSLVMILLVTAFGHWLERKPSHGAISD